MFRRIALLVAGILACREAPRQSAAPAMSASEAISPPTSSPKASATSAPQLRKVPIPTSRFRAGVEPGRFPRDPALEPRTFETKVGAFEIDEFPYPNAADQPLAEHDLETAGRLCSERGGRLCTELEWERACRGAEASPFATGDEWHCEPGEPCPTDEGVMQLGAQAEWTASRFGPPTRVEGQTVLRGAASAAPPARHGCARRSAGRDSEKHSFRCCYGAPNGAQVPEATEGKVFEFATVDQDKLRQLLAQHPNSEPLAATADFFDESSIPTVLDRGTGDRKGFLFTTRPLVWRPSPGTEYLVLVAQAGKAGSAVLAFHSLGSNEYRLASSFVMPDDTGPFALAYSPSIRPRLHFSNCWGCPGETGKIIFREPDSVSITQP